MPAVALQFRSYLRWLCAIFALLYVLPVLLLQIPGFEHWGGSSFGPALDYGFGVENENADVLIFGDSSAAIGIDPQQMSSELGLKVIDLPNTSPSLQVTGEQNLQHYLAHNRPPRLIVFVFTPWNLNYLHEASGTRLYEGEEMLARHGTRRQIAHFVRSNSSEALQFPFHFYAANPPAALRSLLRREHPSADVARTGGHADPLAHRPSLTGACVIPYDQLSERPTETLQSLLRNYQSENTDVMVYLAPVPDCSNVAALTTRDYSAIGAAPPQVLPATAFKTDLSYAHLMPAAVPAATHSLAESIRERLYPAR